MQDAAPSTTLPPKVSVIIPVYGVELYIAATLQSVLNQTLQDFEILIIDDESPDRSVEICQQFTDGRIRIVRQKNRGLAGSRNTGVRHARGEYLAFLDGDDLWEPEKLETHLRHLEGSPTVGVSFSRSAFIDEAGHPLGTYLMPQLTNITLADLLKGNPVGNGSAAVVRRPTLEAIRFEGTRDGVVEDYYFDEAFRRSEDIECWIRITILTEWRIEGLPEALTLYRVNAGGLSANLYKQLESWEQVMAKIRTYAPAAIAPYERQALAYYMQVIARIAIRLRSGSVAVDLSNRAVRTYWRILLEAPRRIVPTLVVSYVLWLTPRSLYGMIESLLTKQSSGMQQRQLQDQQPSV